ncbi:5-formyltetrahydrofolate cyclo-ligase [Burkholderiaceae bacterium UC74_6]
MSAPDRRSALPLNPDRAALRKKLIEDRLNLRDRLALSDELQAVLRVWLVTRKEKTIGAYWPIKGEFDPLPALFRWSEAQDDRRIGIPVVDKQHGTLQFHVWYPGCPMEEDAHGIPKPKDTATFQPQLMLVPCVGFGPAGLRIGYGGGFMARTVHEMKPRPLMVGVGYAHGFLPLLKPEPDDVPVSVMITEEGVVWEA